ncbi:hypothetical protein MPSEU_000742400 [Mayamaea pseudoterrestris]|nr:hypothetical protein MPSEU_000742400 [Mayamaea pseudoterrestris]
MPTASLQQGVSRNRSLALGDVFKAHQQADDDDDPDGDEDASRFGTTSTIHHLYRSHQRGDGREDMSEVGNQSVSTIGSSRSKKSSATGRIKETRGSSGRAVIKRTTSRRVDPSTSVAAASGLIELLSPKPATKKPVGDDNTHDEEESIAITIETSETPTGGEITKRRLPSRAKSIDSVMDHKPRGEKRGESGRRTTASRRNFSHTGGGGPKASTKEDSAPASPAEPKDEATSKGTHRRYHSHPVEGSKKSEHEKGTEKEVGRKTSSRQGSSNKGSRQHSSSRTEKDSAEKDLTSSGNASNKESNRSAPRKTSSSRVTSRATKTDITSSPRRSSKPEHEIKPKRSPSKRQVSESKQSAMHESVASLKYPSNDDVNTEQLHSFRNHAPSKGRAARKPSNHEKAKSNSDRQKVREASPPREKLVDDYGYGPGSPGRSPKKSVGKPDVELDEPSDASSSIDCYKAEHGSSDGSSDGSDHVDTSDDDDDEDGYANPYSSKSRRKGKYYDDDEDTVLQFDPTQHDGVQEVKRAGSMQYEFEGADGTSVVGQITELADPVGEIQMLAAQQENDRRKDILFDFLDGDDEVNGQHCDVNEDLTSDNDQETQVDADGTELQIEGSEHEFQPPMHFEMPAHDVNDDDGKPLELDDRDQRQDSWSKTDDDDPLSPTQEASSEKKKVVLRRASRKISGNSTQHARSKSEGVAYHEKHQQSKEKKRRDGQKKTSSDDQALLIAPLSPSKTVSKVKMFSFADSFRLDKDDDDDNEGVDGEADAPPQVPDVNQPATASPTKESESPKKATKKKGKGLSGIGRYFGRTKRQDDDDDMMSVGSTSIGFFNSVKAKHQLLGDDSSVESGLY